MSQLQRLIESGFTREEAMAALQMSGDVDEKDNSNKSGGGEGSGNIIIITQIRSPYVNKSNNE